MQLICYEEIRFVEHEATERDVARRSELAGKSNIAG
jgi:hypothetical protein